jgi:CHAD domain-containing protein
MSLLEKRINSLSEELSSTMSKLAHGASPKAVHRLRTTIRRIESLVSYSHPDLGKRQERTLEDLADLRKRAGKVRDMDVQMGLLGQLANGSTASDRRILMELLVGKRARQAKRLASAVKKMVGAKFFSQMDRIAKKSGSGPTAANRPIAPLQEAKTQLASLAADFVARQTIKPRRLHEARIKLKTVRYLAEIAEKSAEQQRFLLDLKSVHDAVGEWHDWAELARTAEKQFADRVNSAILMEVRSLFAAKYAAATSAVAQLFSPSTPAPARKLALSVHNVRASARRVS